MAKKISMQDIADRLGISKNAVSLALARKPGVSEETQNLVLSMVKKLGYTKTKDNSQNKKILVLVPDYIKNDSFFYNDIYWSIEARARQKGYISIMASVSPQMENDCQMPDIYNEIKFSGIILVGVVSNKYIDYLCNTEPNIVTVDNYYCNVDVNSVVTANIDGAKTLTDHVINYGHKHIGFIGSIQVTSSIFERWCGFQKALIEAGITLNTDYCILDASPLNDLLSDVEVLSTKINKMEKLPTAFVCAGDRIALAVIDVLKKRGCNIPRDISVVGFDNLEISNLSFPYLTTMNVNRKALGKEAVDLLIKHIEKSQPKRKIELFVQIIERDSLNRISNKVR